MRWLAAGIILCAACNRDRSPLDLWDMRAGMPLAQLDSIATHDQRERFTCLKSHGTFQECWITTQGAAGRLVAIVDSTQHVVSISYRPDLGRISGMSTGDGLLIETEVLRRRWNRTAPVSVDSSKSPLRMERWRTKDGRWTGRIVWNGSIYPSELAVTDEIGHRKYQDLVYIAEADSLARAARMDPAVLTLGARGAAQLQTVSEELKRLADVQDVIFKRRNRYAESLAHAHFVPRADVDISIRSAGPAGWWAVGKHPRVSGQQCVIWVGASPHPPQPSEWRLGGQSHTAECGAATR
jgi:hypothetical protein